MAVEAVTVWGACGNRAENGQQLDGSMVATVGGQGDAAKAALEARVVVSGVLKLYYITS